MRLCILLLLFTLPTVARAQSELPRQLFMGAQATRAADGSVTLGSVNPAGPAYRSGLRAGDRVLSIDGQPIPDIVAYMKAYRRMRGAARPVMRVRRNGRELDVELRLDATPLERNDSLHIERRALRVATGYRLQTIITKPLQAPARLPAVLLVPWLSCNSVELGAGDLPALRHLFHGIAQAGFLLYRVNKPSVGDSEGPDCLDLDLETEIAAYQAGLAELAQRPDVDTTAIFILGHSLGGALAPIVGRGFPVAGYVVSGFPSRSWYEHLIDQERRRMWLAGTPEAEKTARMNAFAEFYTQYLIARRVPADILKERPELAPVYDGDPRHQYGRPALFYQQLQATNLSEPWSRVTVPALMIHGEYDWLMSEEDHRHATEIVNRNDPGLALFKSWPRMMHALDSAPDAASAFAGRAGSIDPHLTGYVVAWLKGRLRARQ